MATYSTIGKPVARAEGPEKVTGKARYASDVMVPGTLWGKALRSPLPHARILGIDTSHARRVPGVHAVLTAADLPDIRVGRRLEDVPILAQGKVRFIGERVAAVAAEDPDVAEEAAELIEVEYEELTAVFDPEVAMQSGAPILHDNINAYQGLPEPVVEPTNHFVRCTWDQGDIEQGFAEADLVFEHTFTTPRSHQAYLEPHACLVQIDAGGQVHVWASNKAPFLLRNMLAAAAGIKPESVRVHVTYIGGDFGGKGDPVDTALCYFLAKASGRPVKLVMTYMEEFVAGNPRHPAVVTLRSGIKRDGTLIAREGRMVFDSGAYGGFKPGSVNLPGAANLEGSYHIRHVRIHSDFVYTNNVPCGFMRGPGAVQAVFAVESHMDMIAHELGMDPLAFRRLNALRDGDPKAETGKGLIQVREQEILDATAKAMAWSSPKGPPFTGRGMAVYDRQTTGAMGSSTVVAETDGSVTVRTPIFDVGPGTHTILRQIVAEELCLPLEVVNVVAIDTDEGPFDIGVEGSWVTLTHGTATLQAARQVREHLLGMAAELLGRSADQIQLRNGLFFAIGAPSRNVSFAQVTAEAREPIKAYVSYSPDLGRELRTFCAQVAEVVVDPETGQVTVHRLTTLHDVGTVLNPMTHQGQIDGGIVQGVGFALMENLGVEDGLVTAANFGDYKIPTILDVPKISTVLLEEAFGPTPYQGKTIGEVSNCPVAAAIANAVADAVHVRITNLPITAEKVLAGIKARGNAHSESLSSDSQH